MKKAILIFLCSGLFGCAGAFVEARQNSDYALTCDLIDYEIIENESEILRGYDIPGVLGTGNNTWILMQRRDLQARLNVLHQLRSEKKCGQNTNKPATSNNPDSKEKSRIIICKDDQTCIIE